MRSFTVGNPTPSVDDDTIAQLERIVWLRSAIPKVHHLKTLLTLQVNFNNLTLTQTKI